MAGKPHTHPAHPDYTPSVFPSVYGRSCDKSDASRFNRHLIDICLIGGADVFQTRT